MKRRSLLTLLFTTTVALSALTSCEPPQPGQNATSSSGKKVLIMVTSPDYPPYQFYDTAGGGRSIVGFDIDIANKIAAELGFELKINESDFNGLIPALQAKRADFVMAGMTPTPERKKNVDFSIIYFEAKNTIIAPKASNLTTIKDLEGKTVGVQLGSIQEGDAKKIAAKVPGMKVKQLNKVPDLIQEIKSKRIDAAIVEDTFAKGFTDSSPDLAFTVIPPEGPSGSAIAFPQGSPLVTDFNKVLEKMIASGEIKTLSAKWFAKSAPPAPAASPAVSPSGAMSPVPTKSP